MLVAAADRMIGMAAGNAHRVVQLIDKLSLLDPARADQVLEMAAAFSNPDADDLGREPIRNRLRKLIHWHLTYGEGSTKQSGNVRGAPTRRHLQPPDWPQLGPTRRKLLRSRTRKIPRRALLRGRHQRHPKTTPIAKEVARWRELYESLSPRDLVIRHRWLFQNGWVDLPMEELEDYKQNDQRREEWRLSALRGIYRDLGLGGVLRLTETCGDPVIVGRCLLDVAPQRAALVDWIPGLDSDFSWGTPQAFMIYGVLGPLPEDETAPFLRRVLELGRKRDWPAERLAAFLRLARDERLTWTLAAESGNEVDSAYWRIVTPWLRRADPADREHAATRLIEAARPISALNLLKDHLGDSSPSLLLRTLDSAMTQGEADASFPDAWHLECLVERLETWDGMDQDRLLQIEFALVPAFRFDQTSALKALTKAVTSKPELFAELVCLVWHPESDEHRTDHPPSEGERLAAENAWHLLHDCRRQPGTLDSGELDPQACADFVDQALALCRAKDRSTMGEQSIGQILAHAPVGADGIWPGVPARDILDRPGLKAMRAGFETGTFNKRGMTSRAMDEGGKQERELAAQFRRHASGLATSHPYLAELLERIAQRYDWDAKREDDDAALNRERY